jgi:hypothetical protein
MRLIASLAFAASALTLVACERADSPAPPASAEPSAEEPAPAANPDALTAEGWGALRIGMTRDAVVAAMGEDSNPDDVGGSEPAYCDQFRPERAPEGVLVMLNQGVLSRISVFEPATLVTAGGFGVGSSAAEIKAFYGERAVVQPAKYEEAPAEDIFVWEGERPTPDDYIADETRRGIRFEIGEDGNVRQVHIGGPDIQLVEGCA